LQDFINTRRKDLNALLLLRLSYTKNYFLSLQFFFINNQAEINLKKCGEKNAKRDAGSEYQASKKQNSF
jgi:hypothetical protein